MNTISRNAKGAKTIVTGSSSRYAVPRAKIVRIRWPANMLPKSRTASENGRTNRDRRSA